MPPFDTLLQIDSSLTDWLVNVAATTDEERADVKRVLALRADLDQKVNALVAYRLQMAVATLPAELAELNEASAAMQSVEKRIESVQSVLSALSTAVTVAAKFASFVV
jgi:DNA anti-recombination protein RmuC